MTRLHLFILSLLACLQLCAADKPTRTLADIRAALQANSTKAVQEKVYIHTDNTCYFVGDTLWYKAYVVRADDLRFTDMSRILYVELLTPDGLVVERQNLIVSDKGLGNGAFILHDSLYSGYYELRAYTRWMLNFNVSVKRHSQYDRHSFYSNQMAADFFRQWEGLYSRVLPVYSKPDSAGDFSYKRIVNRPKQRIIKQAKDKLTATFYPEGGHLVQGVPNRVAFELTTQEGEAVNQQGQITDGDNVVATATASHMGRGTFTVTPGDKRLKATFAWRGKTYDFNLPKAEDEGVAMTLEGGKATFTAKGIADGTPLGVSILCRGVLHYFDEVTFSGGKLTVSIPGTLPTGVNDLTLFTASGEVLADRLFFVNHHDRDALNVTSSAKDNTTYDPYQPVTLDVECQGAASPTLLSVAVRDTRTDETSYNDGDIMTDLLLGSELKGFVANPAYYFEADDEAHRSALDLLMLVQGWRKYKWNRLADSTALRYEPEQTLTVEGAVYKMLSTTDLEPEEIPNWQAGVGATGQKSDDEDNLDNADAEESNAEDRGTEYAYSVESSLDNSSASSGINGSSYEMGDINNANAELGVNHGGLRKEVMVEAEIIVGTQVVGGVQKTHNGGRFLFQVPPYYGFATLNMKAYNEKDSTKKGMLTSHEKDLVNEEAYADYYVKRDLFYPRFPQPYTYYQNHAPEYVTPLDTVSDFSMENDDHLLQNVNVKGRRRGKRAIDYKKPAFVTDAYEIYNDLTDYGLSYGRFDMRMFPVRVCQYLFGNMGRYVHFNVNGRIDGYTFYRNYVPDTSNPNNTVSNRNLQNLFNTLKLKRLADLRIFTDFEPRNEDAPMENSRLEADATVEFVPIENDAVQTTFRDRHIILAGFDLPMEFYQPDYSQQQPAEPTDYRRTLYWNPNLLTDEQGHTTVDFYTGSKPVRVKVSACGITPDGRFVTTK